MKNIVSNTDKKYKELLKLIENRIDEGATEAAKAVLKHQLDTYWDTGRYIVEYEQDGLAHAEYGLELLKRLAKDLTLSKGKGFSRSNLYAMRKFYLLYSQGYEEVRGLTWSHICELINIDDELERNFYARECISEKWSVRTLQRQKKSALFLRLATHKNKEGILELASKGIQIFKPEDIIKDTYTLEFLNIDEKKQYSENTLQIKILTNLKEFLLELGKGFTFVKEQYPILINNKTYHCDLVFYHRILKCFVLIDLKVNGVKHFDIGQMNMYMGYFAEDVNELDDNPPIGIVLAREKDELLVKYATYGMDKNLFVSKYELYLPDKDELQKLVSNILEDDEKLR